MTVLDLEAHRILIPIPSIHLVPNYITPEEESYLTRKIDQVGNSNAIVKPDLSISVRAGGWQRVNGRRSMYWGGTMTPKGRLVPQSPPSFMTDEWPHVFRRLSELNIFASVTPLSSGEAALADHTAASEADSLCPPNHCLVNEYNPGDGILPHLDGLAYLPAVATISLESDTVYEFHCYSDRYRRRGSGRPIAREPLFTLFVPRRSLLVIAKECYSDLLHSIPARPADLCSPHLERCLNWSHFAQGSSTSPQLSADGALVRDRRISLTCRRVHRVVKGLEGFLK
ncbi:hypothetical protein PCASD_04445 [Puccinia coronata f. sp. avenae]|uniref:Fe2OG dioxygenase domain-containing protein n=1 Tax=Puccinia coronata f. sp. avenae TaxID=200324 RepID=A0A2N5VBV8_9BASI|nr:hypothetical protein PCASD_04445 [Puccinia coronata f. sp. avenae]